MGKRVDAFKSLPWWAKLGAILVAVGVGFIAWAFASGMQSNAEKQEALDGCNKAIAMKGGAVIGSPYASDYPGGWGVTGQALVGGQQVAFDCSKEGDAWTVDLLP